jgi:hypothetical protein
VHCPNTLESLGKPTLSEDGSSIVEYRHVVVVFGPVVSYINQTSSFHRSIYTSRRRTPAP